MRRMIRLGLVLSAFLFVCNVAHAKDLFLKVPLGMTLLKSKDKSQTWAKVWRSSSWLQTRHFQRAYIILDGPGEALLDRPSAYRITGVSMMVRIPSVRTIKGRLFLPNKKIQNGMTAYPFEIPLGIVKTSNHAKARLHFFQAKESLYRYLLNHGVPGTAWIQYQRYLAKVEQDQTSKHQKPPRYLRQSRSYRRSYSMLSGGRAISENLQLRSLIPLTGKKTKLIQLKTVRGIRVSPYDFKKHTKGKSIPLDPLSPWIPADQHVAFFSSLNAFLQGAKELKFYASKVMGMNLSSHGSEDILKRYLVQLALSPLSIAKHPVAKSLQQIAITGSDPYFILGTDVAVVFQTKSPKALNAYLAEVHKQVVKTNPKVKVRNGTILGVVYHGIKTHDRLLSSYRMVLGQSVVVTNSLFQLNRIVRTYQKKLASVHQLDEYKFFRMRYPLGGDDEKAFVLLTDGAIRRWGSPTWRINASRRHRVAGVLAGLKARHIANPSWGNRKTLASLPWKIEGSGSFQRTEHSFRSSVYGSLKSMRPLAEVVFSHGTEEEVAGYKQWRTQYERQWNGVFDPIAFQISLKGNRVVGDLSVIPLIGNSRYRRWLDIMQGMSIKPGDGSQFPGVIAQLIVSLNAKKSRFLQMVNRGSKAMTGVSILSWLGDHLSLHLEPSPFWQRLLKSKSSYPHYLERHVTDAPIVLAVAVRDQTKVKAFMKGLRTLSKRRRRRSFIWTDAVYQGQPYTKITSGIKFYRTSPPFRLFYTITNKHLVVTPVFASLTRAIQLAKTSTTPAGAKKALAALQKDQAWFGKNIGMQWTGLLLKVIAHASSSREKWSLHRASWRNIPILNEWKRLFPKEDPVAVHQRVWSRRLVCPGGGTFRWNATHQTMESSVYGHPGQPKTNVKQPWSFHWFQFLHLGISFEMGGLRARGVLHRTIK